MAIVNKYSGFTLATQAELNAADNDSDFGENLNRNIAKINQNYALAAGISNTYQNNYINQFGASSNFSTNEQRLVQNLIRESINVNGITVRYMPRTAEYTDNVFNERPESKFHKGFQCDMILVAAAGFEGEGDVMTTYGVEFREEVILTVAINKYEDLVSNYDSDLRNAGDSDADPVRIAGVADSKVYNRQRPLEGDLVVIPFGRSAQNKKQYVPKVFEISRVTTYHDGAFFQIGDNYQYKLRCKLFELSGEDLGFNPNAVQYDTVTGKQLTTTTEKIERAVQSVSIIDSDTMAININKDSDILTDTYAKNIDIESRAQQQVIYDDDGNQHDTQKVVVEDYGKTAFGVPGILDDLDDI